MQRSFPSTSTTQGVTTLLGGWRLGLDTAREELFVRVYDRLLAMASAYLRRERCGHTLDPAALVHEAYVRLIAQRATTWESRSHFYAVAAGMMRRVLLDHARHHGRAKRGGDAERVPLTDVANAASSAVDLLALDDALSRLAAVDPERASIVELRFFAGFSVAEIAQLLASSTATVTRRWRSARAWLHRKLSH